MAVNRTVILAHDVSASLVRERLVLISLLSSAGLLLIAIADNASSLSRWWAEMPFWCGLALIILPTAVRSRCTPSLSGREGYALTTGVAMCLYFVKLLHSPHYFTSPDEFYHWRGVMDVLDTHRLFGFNPLLPEASAYPGLSIVTSAVSQLGGLSPFIAGVVVIGAARLLFSNALFLLYETVAGPRVATMASLIYMANPNYVHFQSQFAYESLALPLAVFALAAAARASTASSPRVVTLYNTVAVGTVGALTLTHHLTAAITSAVLLLWTMLAWLRRTHPSRRLSPIVPAFVAIASVLIWTAFVAPTSVVYVRSVVRMAVNGLAQSVASGSAPSVFGSVRDGHSTGAISDSNVDGHKPGGTAKLGSPAGGRRLFQNFAGEMAPMPEQIIGIASVGLTLLVLPYGVVLIWRTRRHDALVMTCAVIALSYPATLALRVTNAGAETSNRASEFVFLAIAIVAAIGFDHVQRVWRTPTNVVVFVSWLGIVAAGSLIVGWGWGRQPGPFRVGADFRSVDNQGMAAARWALDRLGPDRRLIADRTQMRLMLTHGHQWPVTQHTAHLNTAEVVMLAELGQPQRAVIDKGRIDYVVLDRRIADALPVVGFYFEPGEPDYQRRWEPADLWAIAKFDRIPGASRIYDSGAIQVYDIQGLRHGPSQP